MRKATKMLALAMAVLMIISSLTACGGTTTPTPTTAAPAASSEVAATAAPATSSEAAATAEPTASSDAAPTEPSYSYALDTSPIVLTNWFRGRWWDGVIDEGDGWEDSAVYKRIEEKTGVSLKYEVPAAAEVEALGPMIAAGTYPDLLTFGSTTSPYLAQMKDAGLIYNLTELSEKYAPALYEQNLITPSMRNFFQDADKQLWFYVGFEGSDASIQAYLDIGFAPTSGENIIYVRKDMLKAWGKNDIANWADFNDLLAFISKNYKGTDAIRLDTGTQLEGTIGRHFLSAFGVHLSRTYVDTANKQLLYMMKDPKAVDFLTWLNGLYGKGIINDTMISDTQDIRDEKVYAGNYGVIVSSSFNASNTINTTIEKNNGNADKNYVALSQVSFNDKGYFQTEPLKTKGYMATAITKNCKNPDRAIRLLEYLTSEDGQVTGILGVEGVTWEWKDNKRVLMEEPAKLIASNLTEYVQKYKVLGALTEYASQVYWAKYCDDFLTPTGYLRQENNALLGPFLTELWNFGFVNTRESLLAGSEEEIIGTKLRELEDSYSSKMITAKSQAEFDGYLASLLKDADEIGLAKLEAWYTNDYLNSCKMQGITPWEKLYGSIPVFTEKITLKR